MKKEEQIALDYLNTISNDVVYEPDGKIPPDFKLNQIIAVEVRRLNQNVLVGKKPRGIEQEQIRLYQALARLVREFDSPIPTNNFLISLDFKRPIGKISNIESVAKRRLSSFLQNKPATPFEIKLSSNVSITVIGANRKGPAVFHIGSESDWDSSGWVGPLYADNINRCIAEKTKKIQAYKSKYSEWWLVLVDFLAGGIGEPERTFIIQRINKGSDWKKIAVIDPETKKEILKIGLSDFIVK